MGQGFGSSDGARPAAANAGGLRVIYYWAPREETIYMLYVYAKSEQGDLTPAQLRLLARLVREEFK